MRQVLTYRRLRTSLTHSGLLTPAIASPAYSRRKHLAIFNLNLSRSLVGTAVNCDNMAAQTPHPNRLVKAKSPYLLQHASNPVDWYEWSEEAFERAVTENKPIFLSVGYSACHWCHVLAHESFEDQGIARVMNKSFINIKVDREERPDVDRLYMTFVQATSGRGGWPMSVWMTPELAPFFAGTYFPKQAFKGLCERIAATWTEDPSVVRRSGDSVIEQLREMFKSRSEPLVGRVDIAAASKKLFEKWKTDFDPIHAGFGDAPKFPSSSMTFYPLLRHAHYTDDPAERTTAIDMVTRTLLAIHRGGISDHVGKGIARYSVDAEWRLPHFEKMLYDQAQLLTASLECSMVVKDHSTKLELQRMAAGIIEYAGRDLRSPEGAFYSAEDADSLPTKTSTKKKEGAFYVWAKTEIENILGDQAPIFEDHFGVQWKGNVDPAHDAHNELTNQNQLYIRTPLSELAPKYSISEAEARQTIDASLAKLKEYREANRPRPHLDDKIVTAWNGMMLSALSLAASVLPSDVVFSDGVGIAAKSLEMAESIVSFTRRNIWDSESRELCRSWREGRGPAGMCEDYAGMISGLLDIYEATGHEDYLLFALELQKRQDELFWDEEGGGYFASPAGDRRILLRLKDSQDGAEPSALSISVSNLYRLSYFITAEESQMRAKADKTIASQGTMLDRAPYALGTMVVSAQLGVRGLKQIIVTGSPHDENTKNVLRSLRSSFVPNKSLIVIDSDSPPIGLAKRNEVVRSLVDGLASGTGALPQLPEVRICEGGVCGLPLRGSELENIL